MGASKDAAVFAVQMEYTDGQTQNLGATFADSKTILTNSHVSNTVSPTKRLHILVGCAKCCGALVG